MTEYLSQYCIAETSLDYKSVRVVNTRVYNSDSSDEVLDGGKYAWGRTARLICEDHYQKAYDNTQGPYVHVDLCSSMPIFPQIVRERHRAYCYETADEILGGAVDQLITFGQKPANDVRNQFPSMSLLSSDKQRTLKSLLAPRKSVARKLIHSALHAALYNGCDIKNISSFLVDEFKSNRTILGRIHEGAQIDEDGKQKGGWDTVVGCEASINLQQLLRRFTGKRESNNLLRDISIFLGNAVTPLIRDYKVVSLDRSESNEIIMNGRKSFPSGFRNTEFFERSERLSGCHIQGDVFHLPFASESISYFSSVEGYPFYFSDMPLFNEQSHWGFAYSIFNMLKAGGRATFFPWSVGGNNFSDLLKMKLVELNWKKLGLLIEKKNYSVAELMGEMHERESLLTNRSPVFGSDNLCSLTITKPTY